MIIWLRLWLWLRLRKNFSCNNNLTFWKLLIFFLKTPLNHFIFPMLRVHIVLLRYGGSFIKFDKIRHTLHSSSIPHTTKNFPYKYLHTLKLLRFSIISTLPYVSYLVLHLVILYPNLYFYFHKFPSKYLWKKCIKIQYYILGKVYSNLL